MKKAVLQLEPLTCPTCSKKIETAVSNLKGVESVKVLFNSSKAKIEFDENEMTTDKIKNTIIKLGYEVLSARES